MVFFFYKHHTKGKMDIRFRHLKLSDGENDCSGFALCYDSSKEAEMLWEVLLLGYSNKVGNIVNLHFDKQLEDIYNLNLSVNGGTQEYRVELTGVEKVYVDELKESLVRNGYIFIITAKSNIVSEFHPLKGRYFATSQLFIGNKLIKGSKVNMESKNLIEQYINM